MDTIILEAGFSLIRTMELMDKLRPYVSSRGKVIIYIKNNGRENAKRVCEEMLEKEKLEVLECFKDRNGFYVYAKSF